MPAISLPNLCLRWKQIYFPRFLDLLTSSILCHILPSCMKLRRLHIVWHLISCIQWLYSFFSLNRKLWFQIISCARISRLVQSMLRESTTLSLYFEDQLKVFKQHYLYIKVVGTLLTPPNPRFHGIISHETIFAVCCAVYIALVPFFLMLSKPQRILSNVKSRSTGQTQLVFITSYRSSCWGVAYEGFLALVTV